MKINIESKYLALVKNIINSILKDSSLKIYVFGSRVKGSSKQYSDLDIAVESDSEIDHLKISKINIELEDTTIPYKVDVIDLNAIPETFRNCIQKDLVKI